MFSGFEQVEFIMSLIETKSLDEGEREADDRNSMIH